MVRYEFYADSQIMKLESDNGNSMFVNTSNMDTIKNNDSEIDFAEEVRYLFESKGAGEENPLASDEELAEWYNL